jgi:serine/threonine-protein kinase
VPPELLAVCERATAPLDERYPTARALHDDLQAYLDGDRDLALRRDVADDLARNALSRLDVGQAIDRRALARDLVAALALEPKRDDALGGLRRLLSEPPAELPPEVRRRLARIETDRIVAIIRPSTWTAVLGMPLAVGLTLLMGVRDYAYLVVAIVLAAATGVAVRLGGWLAARAPVRDQQALRQDLGQLALITLAIASTSVVAGPFVMVPAVATSVTIVRILRDRRQAWLVATLAITAVLLPLVLAGVGVLPASYAFDEHGWLIKPLAVKLPRVPTLLWNAVCASLVIFFGALVAARYRRALDEAETRNQLYLWQLGQILPAPDEPAPKPGA